MAGTRNANEIDFALGQRIRRERLARGLTQQQVADFLGITYQQQHKYECAINRVSAGRLVDIARAFEMAPGELLGVTASNAVEHPRHTLEMMRLFGGLEESKQRALVQMARVLAGEPVREAA